MATKNLVSAALSAEDKTAIKTALQTINDKMPFLINLTEDQRRDGLKLGDKTVGFLDKFNTYSQSNPEFIPSFLNMLEFAKDFALIDGLNELTRMANTLNQKMQDTLSEVGMEALAAALIYYGSVRDAAKNGVPNAKTIYDDMKKRFPGGGGPAETEPEK
jgi:hypothetical protein